MSKACPKCGRAMTLERLEKLTTGTVWGWRCFGCGHAVYPGWDEETQIQREKTRTPRAMTQTTLDSEGGR